MGTRMASLCIEEILCVLEVLKWMDELNIFASNNLVYHNFTYSNPDIRLTPTTVLFTDDFSVSGSNLVAIVTFNDSLLTCAVSDVIPGF